MRNVDFARLNKRCLLTALLVLVCTACSPSDPHLTYQGIDASGAISMLDKAVTEDNQNLALSKIEKDRRAGFDWSYFWDHLQESGRLDRLSPAQRDRIFALSAQSCSVDGFAKFADLALRARMGFDFVIGPKKVCAEPLLEKEAEKYVRYFTSVFAKVDGAESYRRLAELLVTQVSLVSPGRRSKVFDLVSTNQIQETIESLLTDGRGDLAARLVQAYQQEFGGVRFVQSLVTNWWKHPDVFKTAIARDNLIDIVRVMVADPGLLVRLPKIDETILRQDLKVIGDKFNQELAGSVTTSQTYEEILRTLHLLGQMPQNFRTGPKFEDQLSWYENLLRATEAFLRRSPDAEQMLAATDTDPVSMWLKLRLREKWTDRDQSLVQKITPVHPLMAALMWKIKLRSEESPILRHRDLGRYCSWLMSQGIAETTIPVGEFKWARLSRPGCVHLKAPATPTASIQTTDKKIQSAFDSVLLTDGWNLQAKFDSFDGAFIDLTTALKHPALPPEATPEQDNAVAIPLMLGLRIDNPRILNGVGIYYFIYHYTWRKARDGRAAEQAPLAGYQGANLSISVTDEAHSIPPTVVSLGGPGQTAAPRRAGGRSAVSEVDWSSLSRALSHAKTESGGLNAQPMPISNPSMRVLNLLFQSGEINDHGELRLYIDPQRLFVALTPEEQNAELQVCPSGAADLDCWHDVSMKAAGELWRDYIAACPKASGSERECRSNMQDVVLDRLNSDRFEEAGGKLGPINFNGPFGGNGHFSWNGKEITQ